MMHMHDETARQLRAGIFLAGAVAVLVAAVFLLGRSQNVFGRRIHYSAEFENTGGLVVGAPVRLAGVDVGLVESMRFDSDPRKKQVRVGLAVDRRFAERVRADSVARLTSKGLLGDMIIDISVGSIDVPALRDGTELRSAEREGMTEVLASMKQAIDEVRTLTGEVSKRLDTVFTPQLGQDLNRVAHAAADVAEEVQRGRGLAHTLIYDPQLSRDTRGLVADARGVAGDALRAVGRLDALLAQVQTGDSTLHGLIYRDDGAALFTELQKTAREVGEVADELRRGKGLLHGLIYDQEAETLVRDLTAASRTLRQVGDEVQQGKGTVGALLKDPSVYEDLKAIVGSVQRSRVLRSLIRYEIKHAK